VFIVSSIITVFAINSSIEELKSSIDSLNNNKGYSEAIRSVSESVYMIIKRPLDPDDSANTGSIYIDSQNLSWSKGAGFAVSDDGWIITAKHVVDNAEEVMIISYENGKEEYPLRHITRHTVLDLAILKIDKVTKPVTINDAVNKLPRGYKVGFIGFPSEAEGAKIAHDATISYGAYQDNGFPIYNIHAFVNKGHSGGPVFLADGGGIIGFITSRAKASNLPHAEFSSEYVDINALPQDDTTLLFLANLFNRQTEMFNRQTEMYNLLRTEVSDKTQMGVGVVIGLNKATVDNLIKDGKEFLEKQE